MKAAFSSARRMALAAAILTLGLGTGLGLSAAQAATATASPALHSAEAPAQSAVTTVHDRRHGPRFQFRYNYGYPRYYGYRPYYNFAPSCGWRKRCWYDNWGVRHCRWINTCRRYY